MKESYCKQFLRCTNLLLKVRPENKKDREHTQIIEGFCSNGPPTILGLMVQYNI